MSLVSIIVPIFNAEKYLRRCVESILCQTFDDFELILVNDGSTDASGQMCDEYTGCSNKVHVIHQKNQGVSAARQAGLAAATGDYVIFADPDDWVERTMLEDLLEKAEAENADVVICDMILERQIDGKNEESYFVQEPKSLIPKDVFSQLLLGKLYGSTCNKLYRVETLNKYGIVFPKGIIFCEDLWFNCNLVMQPDVNIAYLNKAYYHYDQYSNDNSLTRNYSFQMAQDYLLFADFLEKNIDNSAFSSELKWVRFNAKKIAFLSDCDSKVFYSIYPEEVENSKRLLSGLSFHFVFKWGLRLALCGCLKSGRNLMKIYNNWYLPIAKWRYSILNH